MNQSAAIPFDQLLAHATQRHMAGDLPAAESLYKQLMAANPDHAFLNFAMGTLYTDRGEEATLAFPLLLRSVALDPTNCQAWNNLGAAYKSVFHHERAVEALEKARALDPRNPAVFANWSGLYINEGCPEQAIPIAEEGLLYDPDSPQIHNHLALACLESGNWRQAWPNWEYRVKLPGWFTREFRPGTKRWHGQQVRNLALSGEQGIGDEILFTSIVPEIRHLVTGKLFIECTARLQTLFERSFDCVTYPSHQELLFHEHDIDACLQLGSLPRLFRPMPDTCAGTPFLKPDPVAVAEMRERLARLGPPPYVGLTWQGGTPKTHRHARTLPLQMLAPIASIDGCTFVSVQYGQAAMEAAHAGLTHWADAVIDFDRHTALIAACDLVISVCQTAVHQAGALGVPCWCLTPVKVAWRYGVFGGERMPWYASVRLLRQAVSDEWEPVVERAASELRTWLETRNSAQHAST